MIKRKKSINSLLHFKVKLKKTKKYLCIIFASIFLFTLSHDFKCRKDYKIFFI